MSRAGARASRFDRADWQGTLTGALVITALGWSLDRPAVDIGIVVTSSLVIGLLLAWLNRSSRVRAAGQGSAP